VDNIATRAQVNKQMLYHYFGNKEDLYLAVLEAGYAKIRSHERELDLAVSDPIEAVRKLVRYTFHYFQENPEFIRLLNDENLYGAQHIQNSERIKSMHSPLISEISQILERGHAAGVIRGGVDPVQLYITIAAVSYFYLSNMATLSVIFDRDLRAPDAQQKRLAHIEDVIVDYLRTPASAKKTPKISAK